MHYSPEVAEARHRELIAEARRAALVDEAAHSGAPSQPNAVARTFAGWLRRTADRIDAPCPTC